MRLASRLTGLDRRWIFLALLVVCIFAYLTDYEVPILIENEVRTVYDFVDSLPPGDIVMISIDYDPGSLGELHPLTYAFVEHCFRKRLKVLMVALSTQGPGMARDALKDISDSLAKAKTYNGVQYPGRQIVNGVDFTFLGFKPYYQLIILGMGQDFRLQFPNDYYGVPLDSIPMMRGVHNYSDVACVFDISSSNITDAWLSYGQGRFGFPLAVGVTGVSAAQYYPYLNSGQLFGLIGGQTGAAQYEKLTDNPGLAKDAMRVQLPAHLVIILFIVIANVGYFLTRRQTGRDRGERS